MTAGFAGLFRDAPRGRAFEAITPEQVARVVDLTLRFRAFNATHWMAASTAWPPSEEWE